MARFSDVLTIVNGKNQAKVENPNGKYPIYGSGGIMGYADNFLCDAQTVVIGRKGNINKPIYVEEPFWNVDTAFGLVANRKKLLPKYLFYFCVHFDFQKLNTTVTIPSLTKANLLEIEIKLPSIEAQGKIVDELSSVDDLISFRKQQLAKLDELVKARFVELFGDPEDSTTGWERTTFSLVCIDMHQGINTVADKVEYVNSGFPIIQSKNITSGYLDLEDVRYVKESDYEYYRNKYNPKPSDLLVCNIGTIGKSLIVEEEVDFLIAWNLFLIKLNKELVNPIFIKVFIELLNQQNYFEKYMTGGTVKFVNKKTMGDISTPVPPIELQKQFAAFVEQTDKSKAAIQESLDKLETLKKALMQKYFG